MALTKKRHADGATPSLIISHGLSCSILNTLVAIPKTRADDTMAKLECTYMTNIQECESWRCVRHFPLAMKRLVYQCKLHYCDSGECFTRCFWTSTLIFWYIHSLRGNRPNNRLGPSKKHEAPCNAAHNPDDLPCPMYFVRPFRFLLRITWGARERLARASKVAFPLRFMRSLPHRHIGEMASF